MICCIATFFLPVFTLLYYLNRWYRKSFIDNVQNKRVFITGTDSGFGRKLALELDGKGVTVYAGCYTESGSEDLRKTGSSRLKVLRIDVTDQESINKAKDFIEKDLPSGQGLWGLVNNAGIFGNMCFDFSTIEEYQQLMDVNFYGPIRVTQTFLPLIKKARGRITTTISVFGRGSVGVVPYCCSKFALEPYCDGLRRSLKTFGVHAASIEPGFFKETGLVDSSLIVNGLEKQWKLLPASIKEEYGEEFKKQFAATSTQAFKRWPMVNYNVASMVTDSIQHALFAKHPKARYVVGYDARLFLFFTNFMPDWFLDVVARHSAAYRSIAAKV